MRRTNSRSRRVVFGQNVLLWYVRTLYAVEGVSRQAQATVWRGIIPWRPPKFAHGVSDVQDSPEFVLHFNVIQSITGLEHARLELESVIWNDALWLSKCAHLPS
jgi:hypothetical protein